MQPGMTGDERRHDAHNECMRERIDTEEFQRHDGACERHMSSRAENGDEAECRRRDDRQSEYGSTCRSERSTHDEQRCHLPANESRPRSHRREDELENEVGGIESFTRQCPVGDTERQAQELGTERGCEQNDGDATDGCSPLATFNSAREH